MIPSFLYKYRSLAQANREHTFALLDRMEINYAHPNQLNDPADHKFRLRVDIPGIDHINWGDKSDPVVGKVHDEIALAENAIGIFSLSECPDNVLMWSHYADSHRGICIGFDTQSHPGWKTVSKVEYAAEIPVFRLAPPFNATTEHLRFQTTKGTDWSHEKEWRCIRTDMDNNTPRTRYLPPITLKRIIFGCQTSPKDQELIRDIVSKYTHKIELLAASIDSYRVSFTPIYLDNT